MGTFVRLVLVVLVTVGAGCSTTQIIAPPPPNPPEYLSVVHPRGADIGDLMAIFQDPTAPRDPSFSKSCDRDFRQLKSRSISIDEMNRGLSELVRRDPVHYHWCFYAKVLLVENELKKDQYLDQKQRIVLDGFDFLTPISRIFSSEYHDSRYLRWAVVKYKHLSEWVFYRKLDLTPAGTEELVQASNPFGLWRQLEQSAPVLEKYNIVEAGTPTVKTLTSTLTSNDEESIGPQALSIHSRAKNDLLPNIPAVAPISITAPVDQAAQKAGKVSPQASLKPRKRPTKLIKAKSEAKAGLTKKQQVGSTAQAKTDAPISSGSRLSAKPRLGAKGKDALTRSRPGNSGPGRRIVSTSKIQASKARK